MGRLKATSLISINNPAKRLPFKAAINQIIIIDGDSAKASWLLYIHGAKPHAPRKLPPEIAGPAAEVFGEEVGDWVQGYYDMEYKKENGRWKFKLLKWYPRLMSPKKEIVQPKVLWKTES
jgi:hypothetical protein